MDRLEFLKRLGMLTVGASFIGVDVEAMASEADTDDAILSADGVDKIDLPVKGLETKLDKPVTVVIIGAGNRGRTYAKYAEKFPDAMRVVGCADLNPARREAMQKRFGIPAENCFAHFNEVFEREKMADAVIISTPDNLHFEPCMKALAAGYDVMLEKPVAPTEKECKQILAQAHKYNRIVGVCHVLRYAPYFVALKEVVDSGVIGDLVSIQHMEPIQYAHMAHSYVRGNWHSSKQTTPIILAKSCHDLDIIRWIVGKPCEAIAAEGSLHLFTRKNMPEGAPERCTDGCPHEATCPYSAIDIYERKKRHTYVFDLPRKDPALIHEKLKTTDYGRCVFRCDNDQCDHYVATMRFEDGITASFTMDAFTPWGGRRTRIMGTRGFIEGDMKTFTVTDFRTGKRSVWDKKVSEIPEYKDAGHGGGDLALVRDFIRAVSAQDEGLLSSTIDVSIESHVMGFKAEKSRLGTKKVAIK